MKDAPSFSRTVVSALVVIVASIAGSFGMVVSEDAQAELIGLIMSAFTLVGGLSAWYFRVKATRAMDAPLTKAPRRLK